MKEYDIGVSLNRIEKELIASMMRNMERHRSKEKDERKEWAMWQAEQLRVLEEYKQRNRTKYKKEFARINSSIPALINEARKRGYLDQEAEILEAIEKGYKPRRHKGNIEGAFFKTNDRKLNALINATVSDVKEAETALLRRANDQYRKIIFDAQVYANTGAGTREKAIDMATKDFLSAGIQCVQYKNGAMHTLSDYADMAIRTASKRAYLQGEGEKRQEWGIHTVIVNKRGNPCPKCLPFVGKILVDDVWSGGSSKDGNYPLMSSAMAAGLYHPRCKDSHTTYFPGISTMDNTWTQEELEVIGKANKKESQKQYAARQTEKYERLEKYSLDKENQRRYASRRKEWAEKHIELSAIEKVADFGILKLTNDEMGVLQRYKSFESYVINDALRNAKSMSALDDAQKKFVSQLDSALLKMPKYEGDLIRTVDFSDWSDSKGLMEKFLKEYAPGRRIKIRQFWSTSKKSGYNDNAAIKIYIQNSKNGRDISSIGLSENEVLYERDALFDVVSKTFQEGVWHILLREV